MAGHIRYDVRCGKNNPFYKKKHTTKTKEKISKANKGNNPWNKDKTGVYPNKVLKQMSESSKGVRLLERPDRITGDGYRLIYRPDSPMAMRGTSKGWVYEQREVMYKALKRPLHKGEIVHHIDGNKLNNDVINLVVLSSNRTHIKLHAQLSHIALLLVQQGVIKFNRELKEYYIVNDDKDSKIRSKSRAR